MSVAFFLLTIVGLGALEFAARWYFEGGFLPAVDSVTGLGLADDDEQPRLVADGELGFTLNPASQGINSFGFAGPEPDVPKPKGVFRVLVLGDSVAFPADGFCKDLAEQLAARSDVPVELFNAAVYGYTTHQQRVFFERDLQILEPDLVVLQYCLNDHYRFLHRISPTGQRLMTGEAIEHLFGGDSTWSAIARRSRLVYGIRRYQLKQRHDSSPELPWSDQITEAAWDRSTWPMQEQELGLIARVARERGAAFAILFMPLERQISDAPLESDRTEALAPQSWLQSIADEIEARIFDPHDAFHARRDEGLYTDGLHLSDRGHRLVGELLTEFLIEQELVPAN